MNKIKYDSDLMKLITLFESMSGAKVRDCIADENITFIIEENEMGKAIGKNGVNIKRVENALKRKIRLVEFSQNILQFIRNMVYPLEVRDIKQENGTITIHGKDSNSKAKIIGRERKNINSIANIAKRYFDVKEIRVV